jgi:acetaldehyde dehydrogenase/alcohol dehydrogenase
MSRAELAAAEFRKLDQKQTDAIVRAAYLAALDNRIALARMAQEETGVGVWQHKVIKNVIATQLVYEDIKDQKTVGVVFDDPSTGVVEIAQPLGSILGFIPVTNPTSTTIFKTLISLKTRNALIVSAPQAARHCVARTVALCHDAAVKAGAPQDCVQCLDRPSPQTISELMAHPRLALILATGSGSLVRKAGSSGTPVLGVGPGNVPVYIGATADIEYAVRCVIESKTLDNGTICASEQAVVVKRDQFEIVAREFERQGGWFLTADQIEKVGRVAYDRSRKAMTAAIVGQSVQRIAQMAGIDVPDHVVLLIARLDAVGNDHPLSAEILAPILAFYVEEDFDRSIRRCTEITRFGGTGHTAVIYSNTDERIEYFSRAIDAARILVNMPSTQGAIGGMYNNLSPSFTLGCGSGGNNITTDNVTARHLLNIHRITRKRPNPRWMSFDHERYLDESMSAEQIELEFNRNY